MTTKAGQIRSADSSMQGLTPSQSPHRQHVPRPLQTALRRSIDIYSLLRSVPIFGQLALESLTALTNRMQIRVFGRGQTIFHQGDPGDALYLIARGQVRISYPSTLGRELTVAIFGTTDFFGELALLDDGPRSTSAIAMCPTITLLLERAAFRQLLRDQPALTVALLAELATRLRASTTAAELFAHLPAGQRIGRLLHDLARRDGGSAAAGARSHLALTQDDLASLAGVTRETVNRVLGQLRAEGLIVIKRGQILVPDTAKLDRALAGL